jgi:hypothetical protein
MQRLRRSQARNFPNVDILIGMRLSFVIPVAAMVILPSFRDITGVSKVNFKNDASHTSQKYLPETMGAGVAIFDYDNDGRMDVFLVNGAALQDPMNAGKLPDKSAARFWDRLYHNNGDGTFTDVTEKAGVRGQFYGMGVAVGDYDNDGFADLYVTGLSGNILYHNNGNGTFTDVTKRAGVAGAGWSASACFLDYDRDGHLDLVIARYLDWDFASNIWCGEQRPGYRSYCHPDHFKPTTHLVYHNQGDGTFTDASKASGIGASLGKGLGIAFNDFDRDGWPDIVIANDSFPQQLFRNKRNGTFEEVGLTSGMAYDDHGQTFAGMGIDFEDYDNDGWPDVFVNALSYQKYALFRNIHSAFEYVSGPSGVSRITLPYSGWGTKFIDYDNDGWKDVFVGQGHSMDTIELTQPSIRYMEPLLLMRNVQGKFEDVSARSGEAFRVPRAARGVAFGDLDNDGFIDIVVNSNNMPALVLRNQGANGNHWLLVNTIGNTSNRDGIGAKLRIVSESGLEQHALVSTAGSYLSASDKRVHFGLGQDKSVKLLEITWPSGRVQRLTSVAADQILTVRESALE